MSKHHIPLLYAIRSVKQMCTYFFVRIREYVDDSNKDGEQEAAESSDNENAQAEAYGDCSHQVVWTGCYHDVPESTSY